MPGRPALHFDASVDMRATRSEAGDLRNLQTKEKDGLTGNEKKTEAMKNC